jgi:hypothetical protein
MPCTLDECLIPADFDPWCISGLEPVVYVGALVKSLEMMESRPGDVNFDW